MSIYQIIIFITKTKIFATEVYNDGKANPISINGNSEIKCDGVNDVDELLGCILDTFNIECFSDEIFDIVIVDCGGDKKNISCLNAKCADAAKLSIISIEKLLPMIVSVKKLVKAGEEIIVTFAEMFYKITCDMNNIVKVGKVRKNEDAIRLMTDYFSFLYQFDASSLASGADEKVIEEKNNLLKNLEKENEALNNQLNDKNNQIITLQNMADDNKKEFVRLNQTITKLQEELEKAKGPTDNEVFKGRLEIVKKYEKQIVAGSIGSFYAKGNIPKKKLDDALEIINNSKIKKENVIALYCGSNREKATNVLIFTSDILYFDFEACSNANGSLTYESIVRIERPSNINKVYNAAELFLQNGKNIILGNKNLSFCFGIASYENPLEWGLQVDIFVKLLKELSAISETI